MQKNAGEILRFIQTKEYTFQRYIGKGGTGTTVLLKDELTDFQFVCKKYTPIDENQKEAYFQRFIDEIKIMFPIFHKNVVRIYNYYLYPEFTTGYILMDYIEGTNIADYLLWRDSDVYENIFIQLIEAFVYLEKNGVLHRDIRNENILVTNDGIVKVIDFGFGKKTESPDVEKASILLNWPVSELPDEIFDQEYTHQTEVYFVGKLFSMLLDGADITDFRYQYLIDKMTIVDPNKRVPSFSATQELATQDIFQEYNFSENEKGIYILFADNLTFVLSSMSSTVNPVTEIKEIINRLENLIKECLLEKYLQDNGNLISCFIDNGFKYNNHHTIEVSIIRDFYKMLVRLSTARQEVVLSNIIARLKSIPVSYANNFDDEDIPF